MQTVKTIRLKKRPSEEASLAQASAPDAVPSVPAAPLGLEPISAAKPKVSGKTYLVFAFMAIAAMLFCLAIIGMQYTEWSLYKADPSVWPVK